MRRALMLVICAALLVALVAANRLIPEYDQTLRPINTDGVIGRTTHTTAFDIKVDQITAGHWLAQKNGFDKPERTSAIFVLVWADLTGTDRPVTLDTAYMRTADGHRYDATDVMSFESLDQTGSEAGLDRYGAIGFEVPPYRIAGSRLVVGDAGGQNRLGAQATVDLGISADAARRLVARAPKIARYSRAVYR